MAQRVKENVEKKRKVLTEVPPIVLCTHTQRPPTLTGTAVMQDVSVVLAPHALNAAQQPRGNCSVIDSNENVLEGRRFLMIRVWTESFSLCDYITLHQQTPSDRRFRPDVRGLMVYI